MIIEKDQIALVFKNGDLKKILNTGKYFDFLYFFSSVERYYIYTKFEPERELTQLLQNNKLENLLEVYIIKNNELGLLFEDDLFINILEPGHHAYWKSEKERKVKAVNLNEPETAVDIDRNILLLPSVKEYVVSKVVEPYEQGLLFLDKQFIRLLDAGNYFFWKGSLSVNIITMDMRQQQLDLSGQELLTKDKVQIRINFICQYKIDDPVQAYNGASSYSEQLYVLLQLILREYIGEYTFDDILEKKEEIARFVEKKISSKAKELGLEIIYTGIKDIILPGEIKDIINQVLIAEKKSQANVIIRREETASTRSLLNTARLMENNDVLYKLKELEYIEKISEKINAISLSGGGQILDQLRGLFLAEKKNSIEE
jgi:regulator of protease activity HflC (stomatin/prohibitin superfamily)